MARKNSNDLARRFNTAAAAIGLRHAPLARALGIKSAHYISRIKTGACEPSPQLVIHAELLAAARDIHARLTGGDDIDDRTWAGLVAFGALIGAAD